MVVVVVVGAFGAVGVVVFGAVVGVVDAVVPAAQHETAVRPSPEMSEYTAAVCRGRTIHVVAGGIAVGPVAVLALLVSLSLLLLLLQFELALPVEEGGTGAPLGEMIAAISLSTLFSCASRLQTFCWAAARSFWY